MTVDDDAAERAAALADLDAAAERSRAGLAGGFRTEAEARADLANLERALARAVRAGLARPGPNSLAGRLAPGSKH